MTSRGLRLLAYGPCPMCAAGARASSRPRIRCSGAALRPTYDHTIIDEGLDLDISGGVCFAPRPRSVPRVDPRGEGARAHRRQASPLLPLLARRSQRARRDRGRRGRADLRSRADRLHDCRRPLRPFHLPRDGRVGRERIGESWQTAKASAVERGIHIAPRPRRIPAQRRQRLEPDGRNAETISEAFKLAAAGESTARSPTT